MHSSLTYPYKAYGTLRVCVDPKDSNKAIIHKHHKAHIRRDLSQVHILN